MRKKALIFAIICTMLFSFAACGSEQVNITGEPVDDAYRNYYEIFVYSFSDFDGDGYGDILGMTEKLDYVKEMGFNGIWLMPIMPSPSYHKYDVTDYYSIDPLYGTMDEFRDFLDAAHERGINVIIDLVLNHTSSQNPWFKSAVYEENSPYREWYNFSDKAKSGYSSVNGEYYEARFTSTMPDLNLDNEEVRAEIEKIMDFWLTDVGVDGFRLDACTNYYTGSVKKNVEFLTWVENTARKYKEDVFIVGEVWENIYTIGQYCQSEVDSLFTFPYAQSSGYLAKLLGSTAKNTGKNLATAVEEVEKLYGDTMPAPFFANHDTDRTASILGTKSLPKLKMGAGLIAMMSGSTFVYYGDEIGMTGSENDPNKRIAMYWNDEELTENPPGTTYAKYKLACVDEQLEDPDSLLNYYKAAYNLRAAVPEIARGESEIVSQDNSEVCVIKRTWKGKTVYIVINLNKEESVITTADFAENLEILGTLYSDPEAGKVAYKKGALTMPYWSIAVLSADYEIEE
ncbi:MAG: hypothetical protein K6B75_03905 [Lachnospiraceae bacterium]|nr:hypothetical protein [Lachnospiraceae bacterium]